MNSEYVTLQDIADRANTSITTVSHVINNTRHVKKETRETVLQAISDLHYNINKKKNIGANKNDCQIGVILANMTEDYFVSVVRTLANLTSEHGISLLILDSLNRTEIEEKNIETALKNHVDGLILAPVNSSVFPHKMDYVSIPIVFIDRKYDDYKYTFVGINNFKSGFTATKKLIDVGCQRIGYIGYKDSVYTVKERSLGYISCLIELSPTQKVPVKLELQYDNEDSGTLVSCFIRDNNLDGILCATSDICYHVIASLEENDRDVLEKIKIITYDDNKWIDYLKYSISVITQPTAEISIYAFEQLLQMIANPSSSQKISNEMFFDTGFIDRFK